MKKLLLSFSFCAASLFLNAQSVDTCTDASNSTSLTSGTYTVGTINGNAPDIYCTDSGASATNGEWFTYVPTGNSAVTISSDLAINGDKDTRVHILSGTCGALTCVGGDDDSGVLQGTNTSSYLSVITFNAYIGETYFIVWDNKWTDSSNFDFVVSESPIGPPPPTPPISFTQQSINATGYDRAIVDMNGDYLDDTVSIEAENININYQLPGGGFNNVNITTTPADFLPSWSMAAGDFDANGYNDLMYGSTNGVTFMRANADGTGYTEISGPENVFSQRSNFVDINNDGFLDAFMCHDTAPSISYINDGNNNLVYGNTNGLGNYASGGNYASVWIDFDNDHDIDMFMAKCGGSEARRTNQLYRNNGDGTYTEIGASAGLADIIQTWSAAWGDYDNDGDMDVYVGSSATNNPHKLMRNNGDNTFTDVTSTAGITSALFGHENVPGDFNNDGYLDVFSNSSILFGNGDLTFTVDNNVTLPSAGAIGDINNDGFLDFFNGSLFVNNTNNNNWIKIITVGDQSGGFSNINGIGARVEINSAMGTQIRDVRSGEGFKFMHSLNTHFGIGQDTDINSIRIYWPSGVIDDILNPNINTAIIVTEGSTLSLENSFVSDLVIYPNPAKDKLNIKSSENLSDAVYSIFDINGKRILNSKLEANSIDVKNLSTGQYILRIVSGTKIKSQKFIKQ